MSDEAREVQVGQVVVTKLRREPSAGFGSRKHGFPYPIMEVWSFDGTRMAIDCDFADFERNYWMNEYDRVSLALERAQDELKRRKQKKPKKAASRTPAEPEKEEAD